VPAAITSLTACLLIRLQCENLESLVLIDNEISKKKHYKNYLLHKLPQLKFLDFAKIKTADREEATKAFKGKAGERLTAEIQSARAFVPGESASGESRLSEEQINEIKAAINKATTIDEVNRLEKALKSGEWSGAK
jgi:U2 small nuclear ribonucleoprotein A'